MRICVTITILLTLVTVSTSQVIETEEGKIEFIGLKTLGAQALIDSMKSKHPNQSIAFCAGELAYDFEFGDVLVSEYPNEDYLVISLIDKADANNVKYLDLQQDTLANLPEWEDVINLNSQLHRLIVAGLYSYHHYLQNNIEEAENIVKRQRIDVKQVTTFWKFLESHSNSEDKDLALWVLNHDSNLRNRMIAAAILIKGKVLKEPLSVDSL